MRPILLLLIAAGITVLSFGQNSLIISVKDAATQAALPHATATIPNQNSQMVADTAGIIRINNLAAGSYHFRFSFKGYESISQTIVLPAADTAFILLTAEEEELGEVIVQSTRTSRTIRNTPTRVELIDAEEIDEKANMRPANVAMLLHESTGIRVQQTSATSANASIRMQGLDGRYTQLLKDGYPNFGNFANGLSILEIPPLDLQQVEIIKGPASTLYGGGAIAGVVNFISKTPGDEAEHSFLLNQSAIGQTNVGGYASQKGKLFGYAVLGLVNYQRAYDVDKDDFSELPLSKDITLNPRLFYYPNSRTTLMLGNSFTTSSRTGGDMLVIKKKESSDHTYFEKNNTVRNTTTLELNTRLSDTRRLQVKQSLSLFNRKIGIPGFVFEGLNTNSYSEVSYVINKGKHTLVGGGNYIYDRFKQQKNTASINQTATTSTGGLYVQHTWDISEVINVESGLRMDASGYRNANYHFNKAFLLPRISALFKISNSLSSRIGGGLGYKMPTVFTEQTETLQYQQVLALNRVQAEKSAGATADINYRTRIFSGLQFAVNQLFFYTRIHHPLQLSSTATNMYFFENATQPVQSRGFETNLKLVYKNHLKLFTGYTYTHAKAGYLAGKQYLPLTPKHQLNLALIYEREKNIKLGLEGYFTDHQYLSNGSTTPVYWELGFMAEKTIGKIALFVNFENFTDTRQSRYKPVVNPPHNAPTFDEIWTHVEGFVVNGGIKWRW